MLPPSKSEYDQDDAAEHDLEEQMRAAKTGNPEHDGVTGPEDELDVDADPALDPDADEEDLGQEEEPKPKKKGIGKGTIFAGVGAVVLVALCGAAYVMQGQMKAPAPVSKKIAVDPSFLENKPAAALPVEPSSPLATPAPVGAPSSGTEVTPNLGAAVTTPTAQSPSSVSTITAPPSDPFGGTTSAPVAPAVPSATPTPVVPAVTPVTPAPVVTTPAKTVAITPVPGTEGPRADPFGAVIPEKPVKVEKPVVEKPVKAVAEPVVKAEKPVKAAKIVKAKPAAVDIDEVEIVKPRVVKKAVARKPRVIRQDMTVSEPHPSQERVQPQSSESFQGYEKLF